MAQIDSRLQPLFAVMNNAGFDWVVSEILDSLRQGRPRLASKSELEKIRAKIERRDDSPEDNPEEAVSDDLIAGDDQIDFVVELLRGQFENVAGMLNESSENLRAIVISSEPSAAGPKIAFQVDDGLRFVTTGTTAILSEHINRLNESVSTWATSVRGATGEPQ